MSKCSNCLFKSNYKDMGWSADVCTRGNYRLDEAIEAVKNPEACQWHITREQMQKYQERMQAPTADVVPKSEYDDLQSMLDAAIAGQETLQKALAEAKSNNEIRGESFYFELEKLEERGKQLEREHDAEVARRIFEEMEQSTFGDSAANLIIMPTKDFTKLKKKFCVAEQDSDSRQTVENEKKYMEGKTDENISD